MVLVKQKYGVWCTLGNALKRKKAMPNKSSKASDTKIHVLFCFKPKFSLQMSSDCWNKTKPI